MKLRSDVCCLLMDFECEEASQDSSPYIKNFITWANGDKDFSSLWNFLWFLNSEMKKFKKERGIESFQEYLDNKYPPKEKITCNDDADD